MFVFVSEVLHGVVDLGHVWQTVSELLTLVERMQLVPSPDMDADHHDVTLAQP